MLFGSLVAFAGLVAGAVAAVSGFGIGSLLTPVLATRTGTKVAVAAIAIPHFIATAQRFWMMRHHVDRGVLLRFGLASGIGGLIGALGYARLSSRALAVVFGFLLLIAAISEFTGWMQKVRWGKRAAWVAGALSGALGGLVGNQGSVRTAALLGFDVPKEAFVATATAIALFVDTARLPVYLATQWREIAPLWPLILTATAAAIIGTIAGARILGKVPQSVFRRIVAVMLFMVAIYMILAGGE